MARPGFTLIEENDPDELPPGAGPGSEPKKDAGVSLLSLALVQLSKRTVIALSQLFTLLTVASVWWLFMQTTTLDTFALIKLGSYAAFVIVVNWIVRRD